MPFTIPECAHNMLGVPGRMLPRHARGNGTWAAQKWVSERRQCNYSGYAEIQVEIRFDDSCGNGHDSFSITAEIRENGRWSAGGCLHSEIAEAFPELAPLIRWHLCSTDGPMHYIANTVYLAGNRDHNGLTAGQPWAFDDHVRIGGSPVSHELASGKFAEWLRERVALRDVSQPGDVTVTVMECPHKDRNKATAYKFAPKYTLNDFGGGAWHLCPFDTRHEADEWAEAFNTGASFAFVKVPTLFSEGKERQLDAARSVAVWPEATDAELCAEPDELRAVLAARLPALLQAFREAMTGAGLLWSPEAEK